MSIEIKTHYRKVFKSDHLGVADLEEYVEEGKKLIFTIKEVKQEFNVSVAGRKGNHNIAYFQENIKPLVLNATNSKTMRGFSCSSPFVEDWNNTLIELFIDPTIKMKGEVVGGVRIKPVQPKSKKQVLSPKSDRWEEAKLAVQKGKLEGVKKQFEISAENLLKLQS